MLPIILAIRDEQERNYVEAIYELHKKKLFSIANGILKNKDDVKDCVQDVVIILIERLQDFQEWDENRQTCFLKKCCRNLAINKYNKKARRSEYEFSTTNPETREEIDIEDETSDIQKIFLKEETSKIISKCIKDMPSQYGDLLFFKYYFGMKNIDIAKMLSLPDNTVNVRIMRAKAKLKECLRVEGYVI